MNLENTIERLSELIKDDNIAVLREELNNFHSADLAEIFQDFSPEERVKCLLLLDEDKAAEVLEFLSPQQQVELLGLIDESLASKIISRLPHDSAADVLGDMEDDESESYLNKLPQKFSDEVRELLTYHEETAGGLMNSSFLTVNKDMTIEEALSYIRIKAEVENTELYYLYVTDDKTHLLGVVSLRVLLTSSSSTRIQSIMTSDIVELHVDDDQELVADKFMKYQYSALPVVDHYHRLKGIVTWDDVSDIVEEETTEEILSSSAIATSIADEDEILSGDIKKAIKARIPWLFITLIGEFIAVHVASSFQGTLNALPVIAIFMPLLAGLGGNIGTQSITLMVRGFSTGQVTMSSALHHIFREFRVGIIIGTLFGLMVIAVTWGWKHSIGLGVVVGLAMAINMTLATTIGAFTPFLLKLLKVDPAVASGPVIATTIDVVGLSVYFTLVTIYLFRVVQ